MTLLGGGAAWVIDQGIRLQQQLQDARMVAKNAAMMSDPPRAGEMAAARKVHQHKN